MSTEFTKMMRGDPHIERFLSLLQASLLMIEGNCSTFRAKLAHISGHLPSSDLGADYFDKLDTKRIERHHVRRLEQLGLYCYFSSQGGNLASQGEFSKDLVWHQDD